MVEEVAMLKIEELAGLNKRSFLNMPTSGGEIPHGKDAMVEVNLTFSKGI